MGDVATVPLPLRCSACTTARAILRRPRCGSRLCRECFFAAFEGEVLETITTHALFSRGERVALAVSGGKDSTVLAVVLAALNERADLGLDLVLLSVDEGIAGYRDASLDAVRRGAAASGLPLTVVSYGELFGWTMDAIVTETGRRNNCTFCGVFRRQALDRGGALVRADKIATGHNADDVAETVLMNLLRGDIARLGRCAAACTGGGGSGVLPRVKPFLHASEKEIVLYAHHKHLDYHATECSYAPGAYRGFAREFLKDLEACRSDVISDILASGQAWAAGSGGGGGGSIATQPQRAQVTCARCGFAASGRLCQACMLLAGLAAGAPRLALSGRGGAAGQAARDAAVEALGSERKQEKTESTPSW